MNAPREETLDERRRRIEVEGQERRRRVGVPPDADLSDVTKMNETVRWRFLLDCADHEMTVLLDLPAAEPGGTGPYRHIAFSRPGSRVGSYWFEITSVPGALTVTGDMGTFTFRRNRDMFEFFRHGRTNPHYWAEKVVNGSGDDRGVEKFDDASLRAQLAAQIDQFAATVRADQADQADGGSAETWTDEDFERLHAEVREWFAAVANPDHAVSLAEAFFFTNADGDSWAPRLETLDEWERETALTYHFLWCCEAVRWAVATYDAARRGSTAVA